MKGSLFRVGIDQQYGHWNAPVDPKSRQFVYVPIPEEREFHPGLERSYREIIPSLQRFCSTVKRDLISELKFPSSGLRYMHLDPDFAELTYGEGPRRDDLNELNNGGLIAFYSGLRSVHKCDDRLIYALIGIYIVDDVVRAVDVPKDRWRENAHTRIRNRGESELIVRARKLESGRLKECIPIGEWREGAYRVKKEIEEEWGGLKVKNGFIQRNRARPILSDPEKFYQWFLKQGVTLVQENN